MAEVVDIECPLCANASGFIDVQVTPKDEHISGYGALYAGLTVSQWKICGRCGFVHQNPRPTIAALNRYYLDGNYHSKIDFDPEALFASHAPFYVDEIEYAVSGSGLRTGAVFDIGCGLGIALKVFKDRGWEAYGIEPDRERFEFGHRGYGLDHIQHGAFDAGFTLDRKVDLVFTHHAFEHFADLTEVMTAITRILKPGGFMFTAIPTFRHNRSTMSKLWMNSAHYSIFTDRSFDQLLARYGFEQISHRYTRWSSSDQFGHLARFTGVKTAPETFYEEPKEVARYLEVINPIRSAVFWPLTGGYYGYRHHFIKAARFARAASHVLMTQPDQFLTKAAFHLRRK